MSSRTLESRSGGGQGEISDVNEKLDPSVDLGEVLVCCCAKF